jgi:hypothetical protein
MENNEVYFNVFEICRARWLDVKVNPAQPLTCLPSLL